MAEHFNRHEQESNRAELLHLSIAELLCEPKYAKEIWPREVARNPEFLEQLEARKELNDNLKLIFDRLPRPDISLQDAVAEGLVTQEEVAKLYDSLAPLLEGDSEYKRIALYLPFELLPEASWDPESQTLKDSATRFQESYMDAWESLLNIQDVRANFVDGDVLEVELREEDFPRVVKAAHLIPKLVEKGYLGVTEVLDRLEETRDQTLAQSIANTLPVLLDLGLLSADDLERIDHSDNSFIRVSAEIIHAPKDAETEDGIELSELTPDTIQEYLHMRFGVLENAPYDNMTWRRAKWLKEEGRREVGAAMSKEIQRAIETGHIPEDVVTALLEPDADQPSQLATIDGFRGAVESLAYNSPEHARALFVTQYDSLKQIWQTGSAESNPALTKLFLYLHKLGVVTNEQLAELELRVPNLAGQLSENLKAIPEVIKEIRSGIEAMKDDEQMARALYPVILVLGSQIKGYGTRDSDVDIALFVRPEADVTEQTAIRAFLKKTFSHEKIGGEASEFWLDRKGEDLTVHEFEAYDAKAGGPTWTHILFGAEWEGDSKAIKEIRDQLLVSYFYDSKERIYDIPVRQAYLEELERDSLQYRLMHKGYERVNPPFGGIDTQHADLIDGQSAFWDSGYRQVATKLFAERVFLPKISKGK